MAMIVQLCKELLIRFGQNNAPVLCWGVVKIKGCGTANKNNGAVYGSRIWLFDGGFIFCVV